MPATGGCFWGLELAYQRVPGVVSTSVGYTQGHQKEGVNYDAVCNGTTGHTEAVQCTYKPEEVSYEVRGRGRGAGAPVDLRIEVAVASLSGANPLRTCVLQC